jgi:hypothetical protein
MTIKSQLEDGPQVLGDTEAVKAPQVAAQIVRLAETVVSLAVDEMGQSREASTKYLIDFDQRVRDAIRDAIREVRIPRDG